LIQRRTITFTIAAAFAGFFVPARAQDILGGTTGIKGAGSTVFGLMRKAGAPARTGAALRFFRWCLGHGAITAARLGYVPLPAALVQRVSEYWETTFKSGT
jgi:hypothetical protein